MDSEAIEAYERGELSWQDTVELFQELIDQGDARVETARFLWTLCRAPS